MDLRRMAVVAYHSSPLEEPGTGDSGGMTVYVRAVASRLAREGIATDILTRATVELGRSRELFPGVRVISIEAGPVEPLPKEQLHRHIEEFVTRTRAFALSHGIRYDLVHSHYWQSGLAAMKLARSWGIPFVHSNHTLARVKNLDLAPGDAPESEGRIAGEDAVMDEADVLVASTEEELGQLACLYRVGHDKLKVIAPGVDHDLFTPGDRVRARAETGWGPGPVLLYAGRIQKLKGLDLAIRSLAHLANRPGPPPRLVVAGGASGPGGGAELERLRSLARDEGVEHLMHLAGPQPQSALAGFYRAADVVILCSHNESFGLVALEAAACGTPVVATAVGGMRQIISEGGSGWLVHERDPRVFADRVRSILDDPVLRERFAQESLRLSQRWSWDTTAAQLLSLYDCLVREQLAEACTC